MESTQRAKEAKPTGATDHNPERRSADYKPNIWKYDLLQSLRSEYHEGRYAVEAMKMKEEVLSAFGEAMDPLAKLELIDSIEKLGLGTLFQEEINGALETIFSLLQSDSLNVQEDLHAACLCFRLLRQHGWNVPQDMLAPFTNHDVGKLAKATSLKALLGLFEVSHLAKEGENILEEAKLSTAQSLRSLCLNSEDTAAKQVAHALQLPANRSVEWYNVRRYIQEYEKEGTVSATLLKLAKLNFNIVQAAHQQDLKDVIRWWKDLGITESLTFTRNRIVESFLWSVGVAFEPKYASLRKWLTKMIKLVLVIDDVYDVYGSLEELELFTRVVERWDFEGTESLPNCMKVCVKTLYDTATETALEIQKERGWNSVLPHIQKAWLDFCKGLLTEARWFNSNYTPSLQEYLNNGWVTSCGPLLSLHSVLAVADYESSQEAVRLLERNRDLVYHASMIIRLCNDQGTSAAELERGDAPTSILCYMREANVSEEAARKHIKSIINDTWQKINGQCNDRSPVVKCLTNTARVAHFIYLNGDGFGVQDRETKDQVLALLVRPLSLE